jgi:hypothetical protein
MHTKEIKVEIQVLSRQGKGIREIARETGVARNTVRSVLRGTSDGQYGPRVPRPIKLGRHKDYLRFRLEQAGDVRLSATVLMREIRANGYDGGITQLKDFLTVIQPQTRQEPVVRFERIPDGSFKSISSISVEAHRRYVRLLPCWDARVMRTSSSRITNERKRSSLPWSARCSSSVACLDIFSVTIRKRL